MPPKKAKKAKKGGGGANKKKGMKNARSDADKLRAYASEMVEAAKITAEEAAKIILESAEETSPEFLHFSTSTHHPKPNPIFAHLAPR